jgi:hypothetical protein
VRKLQVSRSCSHLKGEALFLHYKHHLVNDVQENNRQKLMESRLLGMSRRGLWDNIKTDLNDMGWEVVDWEMERCH